MCYRRDCGCALQKGLRLCVTEGTWVVCYRKDGLCVTEGIGVVYYKKDWDCVLQKGLGLCVI